MTLQITRLSRHFRETAALDEVSITIEPGQFLALLGPSGSGKTTLLRILAGLEFPDSGTVMRNGQDFLAVQARDRQIGLVFQHYALFRHLTVAENVAFGLRVRPRRTRPGRAQINASVDALLRRVQLDGFGKRYPAQLSGGQRQRVALARALAVEPDLLLLDEPFGALDAQVRVSLRRWLRELHDELELTTVFVTHDQEEALELADRVAVMNHGRIEQVGTPEDIYQHPATPFVCEFIGKVNRIDLRAVASGWAAAQWQLEPSLKYCSAASAHAYVRPEHLALGTADSGVGWPAQLRHVYLAGSVAHLDIVVPSLNHQTLEADIAGDDIGRLGLVPGKALDVVPTRAMVFPLDGQGVAMPSQRWIWER
jgi:sulfate transport system ATP-binding protein